jgi:hypothetical protein
MRQFKQGQAHVNVIGTLLRILRTAVFNLDWAFGQQEKLASATQGSTTVSVDAQIQEIQQYYREEYLFKSGLMFGDPSLDTLRSYYTDLYKRTVESHLATTAATDEAAAAGGAFGSFGGTFAGKAANLPISLAQVHPAAMALHPKLALHLPYEMNPAKLAAFDGPGQSSYLSSLVPPTCIERKSVGRPNAQAQALAAWVKYEVVDMADDWPRCHLGDMLQEKASRRATAESGGLAAFEREKLQQQQARLQAWREQLQQEVPEPKPTEADIRVWQRFKLYVSRRECKAHMRKVRDLQKAEKQSLLPPPPQQQQQEGRGRSGIKQGRGANKEVAAAEAAKRLKVRPVGACRCLDVSGTAQHSSCC